MKLLSERQSAVSQDLRGKMVFLPDAEATFQLQQINRHTDHTGQTISRGFAQLRRGQSTADMSMDEIMGLIRGWE